MSCRLNKLASFKERLSNIENILFFDDFNSPVPSSIDEWSSKSLYDDNPTLSSSSSSKFSIPKSLNDCIITVSPTGHLIVFAYGNNVAVYRHREEKETQICGTTLYEMESGEKITCAVCLPFISQQISNQGGYDWCAIILGFSSGYIRIFTENFSKLLAQKISTEPVTSIKVNTFFCPYTSGRTRHSDCNKNVDEIFVFCRSFCMIIDGFVFYQTLRSCRNYIARNRGQPVPDPETNPEFALRYKTWVFKDCRQVIDADNCGSHEISDYDYLVSRSISKGTFRNPHNRRANGSLVISSGEDPFIGLHQADEIDSTSVLGEVTQAVVNKVKNVLPTFLRSSEKPKPKVEPPLDFSPYLELYDQYRIGVSVSVSPTRELAAVCDEFGRVSLVNLADGLVIRMWKGYRDAQCGWIESYENPNDIKSRKITFICIYAPKRGLLELWRCQHGPRVHAFNVGKSCRLLYCGYSMLGLNDVLINQYRESFGLFLQSPGSCYLIDYESCDLYTLQVPFVVGLTDRFSQLSKDQLLYKEFTNLPLDVTNSTNFISIFEKIKTHQIKWQAIDFIIGHSMVTLVKELCQSFISQLPVDLDNIKDNESKIDPSIVYSARRCQKLVQLCQFFQSFEQLVTPIKSVNIVNSIHKNPPDIESQANLLGWSDQSYLRFVSIFSFKEVVLGYEQETVINPDIITFAECVDFFIPKETDQPVQSSRMPITLKKKIYKLDQLHRIGDFILLPGLVSENLEVCAGYIEEASFIAPQELLYCLFASWLHIDFAADWRQWPRFNRYVTLIVNILRQKYANGSDHWMRILKILTSLIAQSSLIPSSLISSMVLLTIYSQFDLCEEATPSSKIKTTDDEPEVFVPEEWENLSIVKEKLNLLINQLESTFFFSLTLHSNVNYDPGHISLSSLRDSLPGIVSESIAKWAISYPLDPSIILSLEADDDLDDENKVKPNNQITFGTDIVVAVEESNAKLDSAIIKQLLSKVHDQFPRSMESDVILANCSWECLILWDKDPSMGATSKLLTQSLKYIEPLSSAVLKHNLSCLIWKIAIRKRLETLTSLIEKMGKTPKDRILKRDIGLGEGSLEDFLKFVVELIDLILDTIEPSDFDAMPIFHLDDWWKNKEWSSGQLPLVFVAIQQQPANPHLTLELFYLNLVVTLIVNFQIKSYKPLALFPYDVSKAFFGEISAKLPNFQADSLLTANREKFLLSAASAVALSVPPSTVINEEDVQLYSTANQWIGKIIDLCKHWDIHPDLARQRYICDLYLNCCDALAEEYTNFVHDREALAVALLPVAGLRIRHLIRPSKDKFLASTPQYIMSWLEEIPTRKEINLNFTVETTTKMLEYIVTFLPSDNSNKRTARNLLEITNRL